MFTGKDLLFWCPKVQSRPSSTLAPIGVFPWIQFFLSIGLILNPKCRFNDLNNGSCFLLLTLPQSKKIESIWNIILGFLKELVRDFSMCEFVCDFNCKCDFCPRSDVCLTSSAQDPHTESSMLHRLPNDINGNDDNDDGNGYYKKHSCWCWWRTWKEFLYEDDDDDCCANSVCCAIKLSAVPRFRGNWGRLNFFRRKNLSLGLILRQSSGLFFSNLVWKNLLILSWKIFS